MPSAEGSAVTVAVTVSEGVESSPNGRPSSATACFNLSVTVVADIAGQANFLTPGFHNWPAPGGGTSVCILCIGGGGGGKKHFAKAGGKDLNSLNESILKTKNEIFR